MFPYEFYNCLYFSNAHYWDYGANGIEFLYHFLSCSGFDNVYHINMIYILIYSIFSLHILYSFIITSLVDISIVSSKSLGVGKQPAE